uniref:Uncharacterized protein n=1 Tax=Cherry twisted leaf associated virus TaxID=1424279 RepID=V5LYN1_9VIRU|nr:hypothetical protein [Cherry twisted leaf associated virus]
MSMRQTRMAPSGWTVQEIRFRRRLRRGRLLSKEEREASLKGRAIWIYSDPEGEESPLTPRIPLQVLARNISASFQSRTLQHSMLPQIAQLRQLLQIGSSTSKFQKLKRSIAYLILSGTVITTVPVIKPSSLEEPNAMLNLKILQALLGATALYAVSALNMHQSSGTMG